MKKVVLCILDGFGFGDPENPYNAVAQANTPILDRLKKQYSVAYLKTSGEDVGLSVGQMGNSEVGHMTIGAGRVIYQMLPRINNAILSGEMEKKIDIDVKPKTVHLVGLLSNGGVHSSIDHVDFIATVLKKQGHNVVIHAISDGRDCPPRDAVKSIVEFNKKHRISTICGRYYAMDRDNRNERTQKYYDLLVNGTGQQFSNLKEALEFSYTDGINDEYLEPIIFDKNCKIQNDDIVLFTNFRADRMRQIVEKFAKSKDCSLSKIVCMSDYGINSCDKIKVLFKKENIGNTLSEIVSKNGLRQLHVAETEKYAHVTFFFNGGVEDPFLGEDRILVPSPKVSRYDLQPEMSCMEVVDSVVQNINKYDFIVLNIANCDMVGHTGNFEATKKAVEFVDFELSKLVEKCENNDISLFITADHGNAECMVDSNQIEHTQHTTLDVPIIFIDKKYKLTKASGSLANIAPTILKLMGLNVPNEMADSLY